jgi:peptide-methionine (R)-S-oxide reductase
MNNDRPLTKEQYLILYEAATEPPFSSTLNDEKRKGTYYCAGCGTPLFTSDMKYNSGSGWPSFHSSLPDVFATKTDYNIGYARTEYHCRVCGGHHGHVFEGEPSSPSGVRYCNNGLALEFIPNEK